MRHRQDGASLLFIAIILAGVAALIVIGVLNFGRTSDAASAGLTVGRLDRARDALAQFAAANGRLPCPASPTLDTGDADPAAASATCNSPTGTLPWKTLGLRQDDALDAWGRKLSYRVYTGNAGSLTQADGVSMVKCDTNPTFPGGLTPVAGNSGGLCRDNYSTPASAFVNAGKGLSVNDYGTANTDAAFVVISHGPSGQGAYLPGGGRKLPLPAGADELANTQAAGPFVARNANISGLAPSDPNYFDDLLLHERLEAFIRRAGLYARDWPDSAANVVLNTPTLQAAGASTTYGDLGQQTLVVPNARITAFDSGGNQNLSFAAVGGNEGLGGAGNGSNGLTETGGEGIRIELAVKARFLGITLDDFGILPSEASPAWIERVELRFIDTGTSTTLNVTKQGCHTDGGLASFAAVDAGFDFDRIEIRPLASTVDPGSGTTIPSSFFVSAFKTCAAGATLCSTSLETAGNLCP